MSLRSRATKCSGYIPPSQYVPVYSRPVRTSNVRWHEELSPITPKPSFDDPDNNRSRSIQQAVKAWLESSPKSVIGVRGRSPTDSPRTSVSSPDRAVAIPPAELDQDFDDVTPESQTFQKNKLKSWGHIVWKGGGSQATADDQIPPENKISARDLSTIEEKPEVQPRTSTVPEEVAFDIDSEADNYSHALMEALKSSPKALESYLKPPRMLEKAIVLYEGQNREEILPQNYSTVYRSEGNINEIRGKESEDYPAREYDGRRPASGVYVFKTTAMNKGGDDFASDFESLAEEANDRVDFISSDVSSPISIIEERRFGGEGMNLIQIAGSGEFAAESVSQKGKTSTKPGIGSSPVTQEFDPGAENRRPTRYFQTRTTTQPLYEEVGSAVSTHSRMASAQERYEPQYRPMSGLSAQNVSGGKRDGPTKTAAVVPVPEYSQYPTNGIQEERHATPLEGVDSNKQPFIRQQTLERVRRERYVTQAAAWEEAKNSEFLNRYKQEETKIMAWEDHKKAKAEINLRKLELKLQEKRAKAIEKMANEVAKAQKKAAEKKALAEAKRVEKAARAAEEAEIIRLHGRRTSSLFCFTP